MESARSFLGMTRFLREEKRMNSARTHEIVKNNTPMESVATIAMAQSHLAGSSGEQVLSAINSVIGVQSRVVAEYLLHMLIIQHGKGTESYGSSWLL